MTQEERYELCEKIDKALENEIGFYNIYQDNNPFTLHPHKICVEISWGDWKHDHLRMKWILEEKFGLKSSGYEVTEEDGSDCYSAIHYFVVD